MRMPPRPRVASNGNMSHYARGNYAQPTFVADNSRRTEAGWFSRAKGHRVVLNLRLRRC